MKRTLSLAAAALAVVTLSACSSASAGAPASQAAVAVTTPSPVGTAAPVVTPTPVAPGAQPYTQAEVDAALATEDCETIVPALGDEARIAATAADQAVLIAGRDAEQRCISGTYVDPNAPAATLTPLKHPFTVGDWTVTVTKVNWSAWPAIHKANMFNDKNPKGTTEVMLYGTVKYNGTGREQFDAYQLMTVGASGSEYALGDDPSCGVLPDPNIKLDGKTLRHGASQTGYLACFVVDNGDLKSLTGFAEPTYSYDDADMVTFALR